MSEQPSITDGRAALEAGKWDDARLIFESVSKEQETAEALMGLAEAWWWLGHPRQTVEFFERAYVQSRRAGELDQAIWSALWLAIAFRSDFGNAAAFRGWLARAERALKESKGRRMEGWVRLVKAFDASSLEDARRDGEQLLEAARRAGDFDLELCTMGFLGEVLVTMTRVDEGLALIDEAMAGTFGGERTQLLTAVFTCCNMIAACDLAADTERATQWCRMADAFIEKYGCPFLHVRCRTGYGNVLATSGRWKEAEEALNTAVRLAENTFPPLHFNALSKLAELRLNQGRLEEAEVLLEKVSEHPAGTIAGARLRLARNEPAVAAAMLERHLKYLSDSHLKQALILELLVDAYVMADNQRMADATAKQLNTLAEEHRRDIITARAARAHGTVLQASGNNGEAVGRLEEALVKFSAAGLPLDTARTRLGLARLFAEGQRELGIVEARMALSTFEQLGASADADAAKALLRSLGVTGRIGRKKVGVLTKREQEVLQLVGHGLSNPEIAERLVISPKTASHHVSSVLSKLGLRTRAEAAAYAVRTAAEAPGE